MNVSRNMLWATSLAAITVYLFVTAPPQLQTESVKGARIPIRYALKVLDEENKIARKIYTQEIVQKGKKIGLKFEENWTERQVYAGPLPAQFLRLTAINLEKSKIPLGLYLGSDYPINNVNLFEGMQSEVFRDVKRTLQPQFFFSEDIGRYIYMAADIAVSKACVSCHNKHKDSPKTDWKSGDVMGATTWTHPKQYISYKQFMLMLTELRMSLDKAYRQYLEKVKSFPTGPKVGKRWPRDGYYLPSAENFAAEIVNQTSIQTLTLLVAFAQQEEVVRKQ